MTKRRLASIVVSTVLMVIAGFVHADPASDPRIRQELRGEELGAHTAFGMLVADFRNEQQTHPDFAWRIIKKEMHLDSEDAARAFLADMVTAADELDKAHNKAYLDFLCGQNSPRTESDMRAALDTWDDLTEVTDHNVYTRFVSSLDEQQSQQLNNWLDKYKEGAVQIKLNHDEVFGPDEDVIGRVAMSCALRIPLIPATHST